MERDRRERRRHYVKAAVPDREVPGREKKSGTAFAIPDPPFPIPGLLAQAESSQLAVHILGYQDAIGDHG